jgi:outer membrane protein assembly factor BamB
MAIMLLLLATCIAVVDAQLWDGDWPMFGKSATFQSFSKAPMPPGTVQEWTHTGDSRYVASPAVANATVYLGSDSGFLLALDQKTGKVRWQFEVDKGTVYCGPNLNCVRSSPTVLKDGSVVFGSYNGMVYKLSADGKLVWKYKAGGEIYAPITVDSDGTLFTGAFDAYTYALNPDGTLKWKFQGSGQMNGAPAIGEGEFSDYLVTGDGEGGNCLPMPGLTGFSRRMRENKEFPPSQGTCYVYCLDKNTGKLRWKVSLGQPANGAPTIVGGTVFVGSWNQKVMSLSLATGDVDWSYESGGTIESHTAYLGGMLYVSTEDSKAVVALNASTGAQVWKFTGAGEELNSSPSLTEKYVYVGSNDNYMYGLNRLSGEVEFKFKTCSHVFASAAIADNGMVFITCNSETGHPYDSLAGTGVAYAINPTLHLSKQAANLLV